jgi:hypothetical protein
MVMILFLAWFAAGQGQVTGGPIDISAIKFGSPSIITQIDTGQLKGEARRLAWAADGLTLYLLTVEGAQPTEKLHHYTIALSGGAIGPIEQEPAWAVEYWAIKQDRTAPGIAALVIDVEQGDENIKSGTGAAGVLDRTASPIGVINSNPSVENLANGTFGNQKARVVRLTLVGEEIARWVNERPIPGMRFSWGPSGSGALVCLGEHGELVFVDQKKHRRTVPGVTDAVLPAWSVDGTRLAYLRKAGRNKYAVTWLAVTSDGVRVP